MPSPGAGGVQTSLVGRVQSMMASARSAMRRKPGGAPVESPAIRTTRPTSANSRTSSSPVAASLRRATHCRRSSPSGCAPSITRSATTTSIHPGHSSRSALRDLIEARRDLAAWLTKWSGKYSKLTGWVEENIDETLTFYRLPRQHHKHLKSTNMLERLNEEIKRRTQVVRIFPNGESCLRLVPAFAVDTHENWLEQHRYLNMDDLREHKKEALRRAIL
jgi:hypothetical protein